MLNSSNVLNKVLSKCVFALQYIVCGTQYDMEYYLANDIYPNFATFVKPSQCHKEKRKKYLHNDKNQQERM